MIIVVIVSMVAVIVYELRVAVVQGNQLVTTGDGSIIGTGMSMQYNTISSDMDMQTLSSISNVMFELGTGVNTTSFSFKTNGVSRTNCVTNCNSKFITTFYTSEALVIYRGADMFISNPSTNLLNAMTLHGVIADKNHIQASTPSAMSTIQIVTNAEHSTQ